MLIIGCLLLVERDDAIRVNGFKLETLDEYINNMPNIE